jgi:hypothetical protein
MHVCLSEIGLYVVLTEPMTAYDAVADDESGPRTLMGTA